MQKYEFLLLSQIMQELDGNTTMYFEKKWLDAERNKTTQARSVL